MKKGLQLVSKIIVFAVAVLWVFWLILSSLGLYPFYMDWIATSTYLGLSSGPLVTFSRVGYWISVALVGAYIAYRGFRFVGKWERESKDGK